MKLLSRSARYASRVGLLGGLLWAAPALAGGWADSFAPDTLATYLDTAGGSALVAGAGESVSGATKALADGLRRGRKLRLVMDAAALGPIADAADADIVKKAGSLPVDIVTIVRVFPAAGDQPPTAVVTFYSKASGAVLSAFSIAKGTPLSPRTATSGAVPSAAMDSVSQVVSQHGERPSVQMALEEKGIWSANMVMFNANTGQTMRTWTNFYRGKNGPLLDGVDLYAYLGRDDYAAAYRSKRNLKIGLIVGGTVGALVLGTGLLVAGIVVPGACTTIDSQTMACTANQINYPLLDVGIGVTVAGLAVLMVGAFINPNPVSYDQLLQMVDDFNDKVKKDAEGSAVNWTPPKRAPDVTWNVVPVIAPGGGGLALQLRF